MRILLPAAFGVLAACGPAEAPGADQPMAPAAQQASAPNLSPPGEAEFRAAWSDQCDASEADVGSALCRAAGLGADGCRCDFALGEDEYRRYSAETRAQRRDLGSGRFRNGLQCGEAGLTYVNVAHEHVSPCEPLRGLRSI